MSRARVPVRPSAGGRKGCCKWLSPFSMAPVDPCGDFREIVFQRKSRPKRSRDPVHSGTSAKGSGSGISAKNRTPGFLAPSVCCMTPDAPSYLIAAQRGPSDPWRAGPWSLWWRGEVPQPQQLCVTWEGGESAGPTLTFPAPAGRPARKRPRTGPGEPEKG